MLGLKTLWARRIEVAAAAINNILKIVARTIPVPMKRRMGPLVWSTSMTAIMARFSRLAPKRSPIAKSGLFIIATELIPVATSGNDVTVASRTIPTQTCPSPVFSAIISPYFDSRVPATMMIARHATNCIQTKLFFPLITKYRYY
jgi:hypothetical protein